MKKISMSDYVLVRAKKLSDFDNWEKDRQISLTEIFNYAKFLKQPLIPGMFVSCDEDGILIDVNNRYTSDYEYLNEELDKRYQQAKERVIFEGFEVIGENDFEIELEFENGVITYNKEHNIFLYEDKSICTIEDLPNDLTITETAKQLYNI